MSGRRRGDDGDYEGRRPVEPGESGERSNDLDAVRMRRRAACGRHALHVLGTTLAYDSSAAPGRTAPLPEDNAVYRSEIPGPRSTGWSPACGRRLGSSR